MMLRLLYILLFVVLSLAVDKSAGDVASADVGRVEVSAPSHAEQLWCCRECNSDMLRTMRTAAPTIAQNAASTSQQVRHRSDEQLKYYAAAIPSRRVGHVTRIFEFDTVRSTLRVAYYLYALCRLRI